MKRVKTMNRFVAYMKCSTCVKAKKLLDKLYIEYQLQNIKEDNPTKIQLDEWVKLSGLDVNKFFNTSGVVYKELQLKDKIKEMSYEEKIELLSTNGMLVKRPILVLTNKVIVGYKQDIYDSLV